MAISREPELQRLLKSILEPVHCEVVVATEPTIVAPRAKCPDIVIVDLDLLDANTLLRTKRAFQEAEVIALCKLYSEADCVAALDMGADYMIRPFSAHDLCARVRVALLHRISARGLRRFIRSESVVIDLLDMSVEWDGRPVRLTPFELRILESLACEAGRAVSYQRILAALGRGDTWRDRQALRVSVSGLRGKIERDPKRPVLLLTESRIGYRLVGERGGG